MSISIIDTKDRLQKFVLALLILILLSGCAKTRTQTLPIQATPPPETNTPAAPPPTAQETPPATPGTSPEAPSASAKADVLEVSVQGQPGAYTFSVQIASPDLGCQQYADWWEVIDENGALLYRRILAHSHVNEQPFTRSGGPVPVDGDTVVWVRAHMNPGGYGGAAVKGTVNGGFTPVELDPQFAAGLAESPPLPDGCAF